MLPLRASRRCWGIYNGHCCSCTFLSFEYGQAWEVELVVEEEREIVPAESPIYRV